MIQAVSTIALSLLATGAFGASGAQDEVPKLRFAYANDQGTQLLIPSLEAIVGSVRLTKAVCTDAVQVTVKHVAYQHEAKDSTHRQSYYNFAKDGGERYEVKGRKLRKDASCALAEENFFTERAWVKANPVNSNCAAADRAALEKAKARKLKWCRKRWRFEGKGETVIGFAQFKKAGKEDLAVMARLDGAKSQVIEEYSTDVGEWRADEDNKGEFPAADIQLIVAWRSKTSGIGLATAWGAPESNNLAAYEEEAGRYARIGNAGFYWAPL